MNDTELGQLTMRRVSLRLLPFIFILYICSYLDRTNVAVAALQMKSDLKFSTAAFGLGSSTFFLGYALCEVPSNLLLTRVGARWWIARIMITWGILATAMMFVRTPMQFYVTRFLLGVAEAGFFPGIVYYLSHWFPRELRARATSRFMIAIPLASVIGGFAGGWLLSLNGTLGLAGWQWLFLLEGLPTVFFGVMVLFWLTERPEDARWLPDDQRAWLVARLAHDNASSTAAHGIPPLKALLNPKLWLMAMPYCLVLTAGLGYLFWAPTILRDMLHTTNSQTTTVFGVIACVSLCTMLLMGVSSDRTGERCLHAGFAAALTAIGYAGASLLPTPVTRVVALALVPIGANAFVVPYFCLQPLLFRSGALAVAFALVNSIGNLGGFFGPNVLGGLIDHTGGTRGAFAWMAALGVVAASLCVFMRRYLPRGEAPAKRAA